MICIQSHFPYEEKMLLVWRRLLFSTMVLVTMSAATSIFKASELQEGHESTWFWITGHRMLKRRYRKLLSQYVSEKGLTVTKKEVLHTVTLRQIKKAMKLTNFWERVKIVFNRKIIFMVFFWIKRLREYDRTETALSGKGVDCLLKR